MQRALALARNGLYGVRSNPMVGCVIVADNRIIGEGFHRQYGKGHAEVNAVASVSESDAHLLPVSTAYVTLEPCSHYGKTPPCAKLLITKRIPRVVIATGDPFSAVSGRGIAMLREAGVDVSVGLMSDESQQLNAVFFTAQSLKRPFVTLKWAMSADGFMDKKRDANSVALRLSTPLSATLVHRLRAANGAIMVGSQTVIADNPRLDTRLFYGENPIPIVLDRRHRVGADFHITQRQDTLIISDFDSLSQVFGQLYSNGITSVLVEGGPTILKSLIDNNLWDAARIETNPFKLNDSGVAKAPELNKQAIASTNINGNTIEWFSNNSLFTSNHPFIEI